MPLWIPHKSTLTPPTPPPLSRPAAPSAEEIRARLAEVEAEVERVAMAVMRLWAEIHDMNKEG